MGAMRTVFAFYLLVALTGIAVYSVIGVTHH
jgi:hypothetical protein